MQQAPEYRDQEPLRQEPLRQEPLRREYIPQQPTAAHQGQPASDVMAASNRQAAPLSWSDWVRWGPIWSGFFTIVATLVVLGALGAAIGLTVWGATTNSAFVFGWAIFTGVVAYFLGGWVTARSAGVSGTGAALLNAGLAWALSLIAILALVIIGAGNVVGFLGSNLYLLLHSSTSQPTPSHVAGTLAQTAWITFISLVVGLILAMIGGLVGSRSLPTRRVTRTL